MIDTKQLKTYLEAAEIPQSDATLGQLDRFADMLVETNQSMNLTAITDADGVCIKHLLDSLLIFKYVSFPRQAAVIDVGCGDRIGVRVRVQGLDAASRTEVEHAADPRGGRGLQQGQ